MAADPRPGIGVGAAAIHPSIAFSGQRPEGGDAGVDELPPRVFARFPRIGEWTMGLAVNAPFGLSTEWDPDWAGRFHAIDSQLEVIQGTLSVARPLGAGFSVGAGVVLQHAEARLTNAVDPGAPGVPEGFSEVTGDSFAPGYVVGAFWRSGGTRAGLAYHSSVEHELKGNQRLELATGTTRREAEADLELPGRVVLGVRQDVGSRWQLMAGATWTQWHTFDELRIRFPDSPSPDEVREKNWKSVWSGGFGAEFRATPGWTLRAGYRFENSPVPGPSFRDPRIPDADRHRFGLGSTLAWGGGWSFDLAYAYVELEEATIDNTTPRGNRLQGSFDTQAHIFDLQLNRRF